MMKYSILNKYNNVIEASRKQWKKFFNSPQRIIKDTTINDIKIMVVFIGIYDNLFEITVYNYDNDNKLYRFNTYQEALYCYNSLIESIECAHCPINHVFKN